MSRFILGPMSQSFIKGRMLRTNTAVCGCKCLANHKIRALSTQRNFWSDFKNDQQTSKQQLRCLNLHDFDLHTTSFFKSRNHLQLGTSAYMTCRSYENCVHRQYYFSSISNVTSVLSNGIIASSFHTSAWLPKEESKVEKSVKALKEKVEGEKLKHPAIPEEPAVVVPVKKSLWQRFVAELKHYYHGFRLLFIDIRICSRLLWNVLHGKTLTRRERRQLVRTTADLFRLVPFLVFLLVPFMEFLLPVVLKLFPDMLPSTFAEENKMLEKRKKNLKLKLEMAKFLQDTIHETALQKKKKKGSAAEEFSQFVEKIRSQGIRPTTKEILKFAKLFEDEITLDNLSRQQLQAVCRVLNIQPIGIDAFLRFQLDLKLRQLKADDKMIVKEGIESLSIPELQAANRARGMRALGVSDERLRAQLQQWLTLHLEERIPTSLLLLSRALYLPETLSTEQQLQATITELTQTAPVTAEEVKLKAAELAGEKVDNKTRLEVIKKEEGIIAAETKARKIEEEALKEKARVCECFHKDSEWNIEGGMSEPLWFIGPDWQVSENTACLDDKLLQQEREAAEALAAQEAMDVKETLKDEAVVVEPLKSEELVDQAPQLVGVAGEETPAQKVEEVKEEEVEITAKELEEIESALGEIAEQKHINIQEEELMDLKEEVHEYKEDLEDLKEVMVMSGKEQDDMVESKVAKRLVKRVDRLIRQADSVVQELQVEKEKYEPQEDVAPVEEEVVQKSMDVQADKRMTVEEVMLKISQTKNKFVTVEEMLAAMKRVQKEPSDAKLQGIVDVLDEDKDGNININLALKVLETLGQENIKLSKVQVTEMINLIKAEMELEEQERIQVKMEKVIKEQQKQSEVQN